MTTRELLIAARKRIEQPEHWTKGCYAISQNGEPMSYRDPRAARFCLVGSIKAVGPSAAVYVNAFQLLKAKARCRNLTRWNDYSRRTHADVIRLIDRAIEACDA